MSGQDWLEKDFYAMLGVAKDADDAAIKKAYRRLARQYHPDQNPGDAKAEARFKEIGEAYSVLSDSEQRKQYDGLRAMAGGGPRFTAGSGGAAGGAGFEDIFSGMFGGAGGAGGAGPRMRYSSAGGGQGGAGFEDILSGMFGGAAGGYGGGAGFGGPEPGADLHATLTIPFRTAVSGGEMGVSVEGRSLTVRIPAGVRDGQKIKLRGRGRSSASGGRAGDLVVTVTVTPHPVFGIDGRNLTIHLPVTFPEAALGATVSVPTLDGEQVRVKVPAGSPSGKRLRVRGRGVPESKGKAAGDLIVTIDVVVPDRLTDEARAAVENFAAATEGADPRAGLYSAAGS